MIYKQKFLMKRDFDRRRFKAMIFYSALGLISSLFIVSPGVNAGEPVNNQSSGETSDSMTNNVNSVSTLAALQQLEPPSKKEIEKESSSSPSVEEKSVTPYVFAKDSPTASEVSKSPETASDAKRGRSLPPINEINPSKVSSLLALYTTEKIDLGSALALAGVDNPTINIARQAVEIAVAEQLRARALWLPDLRIGGNYHLHRGVLQASPGQIREVDSQSFYFGFGARTLAAESVAFPGVQIFFQTGDVIFEPLAARQRIAARSSDQQALRNQILLEVAIKYLDLLRRRDTSKSRGVQLQRSMRSFA